MSNTPPTDETPVEILVAEDNPNDVKLTKRAFEQGAMVTDLYIVNTGVEAMKYLRQEGKYADKSRPDLILLDLEMPRKGGLDVLREMDDDPDLQKLPVIVLTSSQAQEDIVKSYEHRANAYLTKPVGYQAFKETVRSVESFWLERVNLPDEN